MERLQSPERIILSGEEPLQTASEAKPESKLTDAANARIARQILPGKASKSERRTVKDSRPKME